MLHILEALCAGPMSLAELSRALETPKSSLAALLRGLATAGFVVASDGSFRLGAGAFGLGSALLQARRQLQSSELVREGMRRLAEQAGETILFAVPDLDGETMTYIEILESRKPVRFAVSVGDRRPLYCTSGGRALLAAGSDDELKRYLKQLKPEPLTGRTETNKKKLAEAVAQAREAGVAQTFDQTAEGVLGTAAVIHEATGRVMGALIVAAPSIRVKGKETELAELTRSEAAVVSRNLGYRAR
ncbi:MAG: IclR family transcriptional regulator [Polyangiales bacterium]